MERMTKEQMIEMALAMRSRDRFGPVTEEEWNEYPAVEKEIAVPTSEGDARVFLITPENKTEEKMPLVINYHGGGFIKGRLDRDKLFCSKIANRIGCKVLDVDYKLAPEYQFPVGLNESYGVMQWAFDNAEELGCNPENVAVIGHSAGGNLAVGSVIMAGEKGGHIPKCVIVEYSPFDMHKDPCEKRRPERDMPSERAKTYNSFYCKEEETLSYRVSPIFAEAEKLKVFPKTLVITAGDDSLSDEGELFAMHLAQAGVEVTSKRFLDCVHGFTINRMDKHEESLELIIEFLKNSLELK